MFSIKFQTPVPLSNFFEFSKDIRKISYPSKSSSLKASSDLDLCQREKLTELSFRELVQRKEQEGQPYILAVVKADGGKTFL